MQTLKAFEIHILNPQDISIFFNYDFKKYFKKPCQIIEYPLILSYLVII